MSQTQDARHIEIDGSYGEGGGQILRTAVALSAITGKGIHVRSIRARRPNPGLQAQHAKAVEAVAAICDANVRGGGIGSTDLVFEPGETKPRSLRFDIGTAGSVTLVMQAVTLAAARVDGTTIVELIGGTHVSWSPLADYFNEIFCHHLESCGIEVGMDTIRHGFYPRGGGHVRVKIIGAREWTPLELADRSQIDATIVRSIATNDLRNAQVAERQASGFKSVFGGVTTETIEYVSSLSTGSAIFAKTVSGSTILGTDSLGKRGIRAEQVGHEAGKRLKMEIDSNATVDVHAADMILPFLAFASGPSTFAVRELSGHFVSMQWLLGLFGHVKVGIKKRGQSHLVTVEPQKS